MSEKLKPMIIEDDGHEYRLEFSRKSVVKTEQAGFVINELETKGMTMLPILFWGAFLMHQPYITREKTDEILFEKMGGLTGDEMGYLGQLYAAPFQTLFASEEQANPRKVAVKF
jgi:hypothetical protein